MKTKISGLILAASLLALPSLAQDAGSRMWASAKLVRYRVEGVHKARVPVVLGDYEGKADVLDRITLEFAWDVRKGKVVGAVSVVDGKTEISNLQSDMTKCPPPQLKGEYEHFQHASTEVIDGELIQLNGMRIYPAASVCNWPASCSMRAVPGGKEKKAVHVGGASPEILAMPATSAGPISVAADRKSFTLPGAENWRWTFFPTLVQ